LGANLRRPFWTEVIDTFVVLSPRTCLTTSIGFKMYFLLTKNSAWGSVGLSDQQATCDTIERAALCGKLPVDS